MTSCTRSSATKCSRRRGRTGFTTETRRHRVDRRGRPAVAGQCPPTVSRAPRRSRSSVSLWLRGDFSGTCRSGNISAMFTGTSVEARLPGGAARRRRHGASPARRRRRRTPRCPAQVDRIAHDVLAATGVPSASVAVVVDRDADLRAGLRRRAPRSEAAGDARDALQHRIDQQAVHGRRDAAPAGTGQARDRRSGRQVRVRVDARQRGHDPRAPVAHLRLPGLLAAGLRAAAHAEADLGAGDHRTLGPSARSTSSRARSGSTATPTSSSPGLVVEKAAGHAALDVPRPARLHAARHDERDQHRRARPSGRAIRPAISATRSGRRGRRRRKARAGCSPRASWR